MHLGACFPVVGFNLWFVFILVGCMPARMPALRPRYTRLIRPIRPMRPIDMSDSSDLYARSPRPTPP